MEDPPIFISFEIRYMLFCCVLIESCCRSAIGITGVVCVVPSSGDERIPRIARVVMIAGAAVAGRQRKEEP